MKIKFVIVLLLLISIAFFLYLSCDFEARMIDNSGLDITSLTDLGNSIGVNWTNLTKTNLTTHISGNFDFKEISDPVVIKKGNKYMMWYSGKDSHDSWSIGYATSYDGISWQKDYENSPVLTPGPYAVDQMGVRVCSVIYDENSYGAKKYKMWYKGLKLISDDPVADHDELVFQCNIFYAYSDYPNTGWIKYPENCPEETLLISDHYMDDTPELGKAVVINEPVVSGGNIVNNYVIWFTRYSDDTLQDNMKLYYSESSNGVKFEDENVYILRNTTSDSFYYTSNCMPALIKDYFNSDFVYKLWFLTQYENDERKAGFCYSEGALNGGVFSGNDEMSPIFSNKTMGLSDIMSPCVIRADDMYKMWFVGKDSNNSYYVYYQESH